MIKVNFPLKQQAFVYPEADTYKFEFRENSVILALGKVPPGGITKDTVNAMVTVVDLVYSNQEVVEVSIIKPLKEPSTKGPNWPTPVL